MSWCSNEKNNGDANKMFINTCPFSILQVTQILPNNQTSKNHMAGPKSQLKIVEVKCFT